MKDLILLEKIQPAFAEGRVCIDYKDPLTGRIREQIKGHNHVYQESLFGPRWKEILDSIGLNITDSRYALDNNLPYLLGAHTGWGRVGQGSSGNYQGTYNTALSSLASCSLESITWKYVYDFTPSQVPGTVGTIGLTSQYGYWGAKLSEGHCPMSRWQIPSSSGSNTNCATVEGRYQYSISSAGVVTKYDLWTAISTNKDISAIVGAVTGNAKYMGYAPDTGHFYVMVYSSTTSSRKVYEFADDTFSSALNTYTPTNNTAQNYFYVYSNLAFVCGTSGYIYKVDYINNAAPVTITLAKDNTYASTTRVPTVHCVYDKFIICLGSDNNNGLVFDMSAQMTAGFISQSTYSPTYPAVMRYPLGEQSIWGQKQYSGSSVGDKTREFYHNNAFAIYRVPDDAPARPSGYGMTITYEIEIAF